MAVIVIFDSLGMTRGLYEQVSRGITGMNKVADKLGDWPVPGLISHVAAPTPGGFIVVDVWESEEAYQAFAAVVLPLLRELGAPNVEPRIYPVFRLVTS
ncbi:hypothetical protein [Streptomyces sp. WMMB 322]|uniref:hypothetical protein n=1 Tax=Streptomyces sp. WMMB 322 TaxID=1286821 RepID=UPI0006E16FED|nr:hypothetical protein [Streptomyces sp. WMMB 322]SCK40239.1 hypothetical protein H180DRAFT_03463 [Streptomyces sp. WMMB 322]